MSRETVYDVNVTIFGDPEDRAVLGLVSQYSGVVALINPNGDEHYIYPTAAGLSAGNKTLMNTGTEDINLVPGPIPAGPFLNFKAPGVNILGNHRISGLVTIGGKGIRGAIGFLTGRLLNHDTCTSRMLTHLSLDLQLTGRLVPVVPRWERHLLGPFSKHDAHRDATTNFTGPVVISGRPDKPSGLGFIVGEGMTATMVWTVNGTALAAGSPGTFYSL